MPNGLEKKQLLLERGVPVEDIDAWEQSTRSKLSAAGIEAADIDTYFGVGPAEVGAIDRIHPAASLRPGPEASAEATADGPRRPKTIVEAWTAGQQTSLTGLATRGRGPDIALSDKEPLYFSIASAFGTLAGDLPVVLPSFLAAFPFGAKIGGVAGGVSTKGSPIGTAAGATFGGLAAGGFVSGFVAEDLRASMLEFYEENKGRNVGRREFVVGVAAKALTQEILARANKEGAINAAGAIVGGPVAGKLAAANPFVRGVAVGTSEMAGSVAFASALEGELPDANEFGTMAAVAVIGGGLAGSLESAAPRVKADEDVRKQVERRLKKTYKSSGKKPAEVVREAEPDPVARERLITGEGLTEPDTVYTDVPPQDAPAGFGEEERLRIHEENVDPEYVKEGKTAWSQYSRALRGKRPAQGPAPESTDLVVFDGAGGGKKPPPPPEGADAADGPATQADLDAILGKTGRDPKKRQVKDIDDLRFEVVDDLQFVKSFASSAYEAAYGKKLPMERNPGELMALARGADAIAQQHVTRGFFSRDTGQKVAPSLKDVFKIFKTGAQREAASAFFIAKRVLEKEAQGFATGFDLDAARRIVNSAEKRPDVVSSRDTKRAFDKAGVEWVRDAGVISAKSADTILAQNEDFIPFFALGKDQSAEFAKRGFQVRQPFKKFTGGDIKLVDPVEALVKNHFYMVRMAENNRARLRVAAFNNALPKAFRIMDRMTPVPKAKKSKPIDAEFTDIGDPIVRDLFDELPDGTMKDPGVKRLQDWTEAGQKDLNDKFEAAQHDPERALVVSNEDGSASVITIDDLAKNTPDIRRFMEDNGLEAGDVTWLHVAGELDRRFQKTGDIVVFEDGRPIVYRARDPRLAKSFEHLTRGELNFVTKVLAIPARVVRTTITTFPTFIKDALIRDTVDAALINKFKWAPITDTIDGVMQTLMKSADFERYVANGGAGAALADIDADLRALSVTRFGVQDSPITKARNAVASGFRAMYSIGATADQFNRAAAAKKAFAAGKSGETGALRGRKVSLDFSQAGASMYSWNQIVAFLGPTINGIDRAVLAARSPAHLAVVGMTYLALPSIMLWAANADQEWYKGLTASEKARNWYFRIGGSEDNPVLARVPKPHAWAALFSTTPEYILDDMHKKRNPNLAKDMLAAWEREWIPQLGELSAVTPFTEVAANHSGFLDRPIVSKRLEENVLPQFRYTPYTSETAKAAARLMPDFVPERFRTPIAIDHLIGAFTNTQGRSILSIAEGILGSAGIIEKTPTSRSQLANSAVIRSFLEEGPRFRATLDEFYQRVDRANQVNGTYKELIRQGDIAEAQKLVDKYGAQMVKAQQVEVAVGSIFTMVRMVEFNKTMSPEEKQQLVNQYMSFATSVADTFNQQMRAIEEAPKEKK